MLIYALSCGWIIIQKSSNITHLSHDKNLSVKKRIIIFYVWHTDNLAVQNYGTYMAERYSVAVVFSIKQMTFSYAKRRVI